MQTHLRWFVAVLAVLISVPAWAQGPDRDWGDRWERARQRRLERTERLERWRNGVEHDGVHLRILRSYTLAEGETATEPVVVVGGSARIDGHAEDDVVVIGGGLHIGPKAVVDGDATTVGGELTLSPGGVVRGSVEEAAIPWPSIAVDPYWNPVWWNTLAFWGSVVRLSFTLAVCMLLTLLAPGWIDRISGRGPGVAMLTGLAVEALFIPALVLLIVALTVSIIGIPLLAAIPVLLAVFALIWVAGFTGVAVRLGRGLRGKSREVSASLGDLVVGYTAIVALTVFGQLLAVGLGWLGSLAMPMRSAGLVVEFVAWTIGLGAAIASLFTARRAVPPPLPA